MEKDDELKGIGNSYDFGARMLDPRVGRWFAPDKMASRSPDWSPYRFCFDNPLRFVDKDGNWETDGHYWTVYMVGLMVGLSNTEAEELARLSELPDTSIHRNQASSQNYTWANAKKQKTTHSLLGSNAIVGLNIEFAIQNFKNAKTDEEISNTLHYLGDAYAHQRMNGKGYYGDKGKVKQFGGKMFEKITGGTAEHAYATEPDGSLSGLRPDLIYNRVELYMQYVSTLEVAIKEKYGVDGSIDVDVFKKMTDFAKENKVSLIGIMNYEVAKLKGENTFFVPISYGVADDDYAEHNRAVEWYLKENNVDYDREEVYNESVGGALKTLQGVKYTIKE